MISKVYCASTFGVDAHTIEVETFQVGGLPRYSLVGLPDRAVKEAYDRITASIRESEAEMPRGHITVNLAPADLPKEGSAFDFPIALGMLGISGQIPQDVLHDAMIIGELALDGALRPVKGVLPIAVEAKKRGFKKIILPLQNAREASVVDGLQVLGIKNLKQVINFLNGTEAIVPFTTDISQVTLDDDASPGLDFSDVKGQDNVKRALEIAAAGGHNIVMVGPPGSGKTMLARRISGILPPMSLAEALETTKIHSVSGLLGKDQGLVTRRPFRSPHHTVSDVALVGGGSIPMPGEISLAHNGVLFLDELPEFKRNTLEVLRQPIEDGFVNISRARMSVSYPSKVMLVASMNPSPSGDWYDDNSADSSTSMQMRRYLNKISGPLLDRIDLHIEVNKVSFEELSGKSTGETTKSVRERVIAARTIQHQRFMGMKGVHSNSQMNTRMVRQLCALDEAGKTILKKAIESLGLSARAYDRILKVARTIADLDRSEHIRSVHMAEAIQYRNLDREGWLG